MFSYPLVGRRILSTRWLLALAACGAGLSYLFAATQANAALISTGACEETTLTQPFLRWGDSNLYRLVPGGDFERSLSGWKLSGGAQRVSGSEPYGVTGKVGSYSLSLPAGSSATSPFTCANASDPTFRFFIKNGSLLSTVDVVVIFKTSLGEVSLPLGTAALSTSWQPTLPLLTGSVVGGLVSEGTTQVALRFTALTAGSQIDDVFIDPRMR